MTAASTMDYIDVHWQHVFQDEPVRLMSELDADRFETRKIELFRDGRAGFADALRHTKGTELGTVAVPWLAAINSDPEFEARKMAKEEFERAWLLATATA